MIFRSVQQPLSRHILRGLVGSALLALSATHAWAFNLDDVGEQAKALAAEKYSAPTSNLPSEFSEMKFADYQQIRFRNEKAYWADEKTPFKISFYHQGMHFDTPVKINEVTATDVKEIKYDPSRFDFGSLKFDANATKDLGYAASACCTRSTRRTSRTRSPPSWGRATSASSARTSGGASPPVAWRWIPRCHRVRNSRASASSGSRSPSPRTSTW